MVTLGYKDGVKLGVEGLRCERFSFLTIFVLIFVYKGVVCLDLWHKRLINIAS